MRRAAAVALLGLLAPTLALAFSVPPPPPRFLHDGANVLSGSDRQRIEQRLMQLNSEGQQIGVAILPSLDGESLEDATIRIAEAWKPGGADEDNGALIAVFMQERKMRIEVGYGLEPRIPDSVARQIISDQMRPAFKAGRFADGIMDSIDSVSAAALGRSIPRPASRAVPIPGTRYRVDARNPTQSCGFGCLCWAVIALMILSRLMRGASRPRNYGFGHRRMYRPNMPWWSWLLLGNAMGSSHRHRHSSSGWSSGGGWSGGGGSWGGGGGSFGGGSFGGGGASGSW